MTLRNLKSALLTLLAVVVVCVSAQTAVAKEAAPKKAEHNITGMWLLWVKDGQSAKFEAAIKQYAAWRKREGDPFSWSVYKPIVGSDLGYYVVRSEGHTWSEIQAEETWDQAHTNDASGSHLGEYVSREAHYFSQDDNPHTHWTPSKDYMYFSVTTYHFIPGTGATVRSVLDKVQKAVSDAKWPYSYSISYLIGGKGGMDIVEPMKSLEGMAESKPSMMEVLAKSLGGKKAAQALMQKFGTSIKSHDYTIYQYRPDLTDQN